MANNNLLANYKQKQADMLSQISANSLPLSDIIVFQELIYRISVMETLRALCCTAPLTTDVNVLGYHYQLLQSCIRFILTERKFGHKIDVEGQKKRETSFLSLEQIVNDGKGRFANFTVSNQDNYKKAVCSYINTVISAWILYREQYVSIKREENSQ